MNKLCERCGISPARIKVIARSTTEYRICLDCEIKDFNQFTHGKQTYQILRRIPCVVVCDCEAEND